jgi:hypothetical protein
MYINEINEIYKNKKQNIHIIIIFLLILIFICIWQKYETNESFLDPTTTIAKYILPEINSSISSPVFIPKTPLATGYVSYNTDISDVLKSSYNDIKKERNINLDNQERINKIDKRINKIKQDIGGINNSSSKKSIVKTPSFY